MSMQPLPPDDLDRIIEMALRAEFAQIRAAGGAGWRQRHLDHAVFRHRHISQLNGLFAAAEEAAHRRCLPHHLQHRGIEFFRLR